MLHVPHRRILATFALLAGLAQASAQTKPAPAVAPAQARVELKPHRLAGWNEDVLRGEFVVFENRATRAGRTLTLAVVVLPAKKKPAAPDPVFYFAGGPGGSAIEAASRSGPSFLAGLREERDVVLVDQRGTGDSQRLGCDFGGMEAWFGELYPTERVTACRDELAKRADLTCYTTDVAMDDLDEVREALGYDKVDLYGGSYGTRAALVYLRRHEAHVRTAVLRGVAPPEVKLPLPFAEGFDGALASLARDCAADEEANDEFPDPLADLDSALKRLDAGPVKVAAVDPATGKGVELALTRAAFVELVRLMLYSPESARWLPFLFQQCAEGYFAGLVAVAYPVARQIEGAIARGMNFSVVCAEDIPFLGEDEVAAMHGTRYGDARARAYQRLGTLWPRATVEARVHEPVTSSVPVLLVSGEADPVTPPRLAAEALTHLPHGRQLLVPHMGHSFQDPCVERLVADFVHAGSADGLDVTCLASVKRPPFQTPDSIAAQQNPKKAATPAEHESWKGLLDVGSAKLHLVLKVWSEAGARHGALDSPDQGASDLAIDTLTWADGHVHFEMKALGASYDGTLTADGKTIGGQWKQGGGAWRLELAREGS
jgi:pimeloyl-ACP methyl ester carboxylesterase